VGLDCFISSITPNHTAKAEKPKSKEVIPTLSARGTSWGDLDEQRQF